MISVKGGVFMKLNHECIRDVLLYLESIPYISENSDGYIEYQPIFIENLYESLPQYTHQDIFYSIFNMEQAGFLDATIQSSDDCIHICCVNFLTYSGHEFLESIRDPKRWGLIQRSLPAIRNYSLSAISSIAEGFTSAAISTLLHNS